MTKYIVSGYIGFDNFGDEAIARVLTDKLKSEGAQSITLISSNPEKTAQMHNVKSCGMLKFVKSLWESDVLISGGGSLLQDVTSLKSLLYYLAVIYSAMIMGKKVEIFAQGIGPINSKIGQLLTKIALKKADKISVRDSKSQELLKSWGIESELVEDPVFGININQFEKKNIIGIQLRDCTQLSENFLKILAKHVAEKFVNKKIKLLSLQDSMDLAICEKFNQFLKDNGVSAEIKSGLSIDDVIENISELEYLIAMRFHANVIGLKSKVNTIGINYDPKVEKLAHTYNMPLIELNGSNIDEIFGNIN